MYYPKSQVKANLYTNGGEYVASDTNTPYKGYYYETSTGEYEPAFPAPPVPACNPPVSL